MMRPGWIVCGLLLAAFGSNGCVLHALSPTAVQRYPRQSEEQGHEFIIEVILVRGSYTQVNKAKEAFDLEGQAGVLKLPVESRGDVVCFPALKVRNGSTQTASNFHTSITCVSEFDEDGQPTKFVEEQIGEFITATASMQGDGVIKVDFSVEHSEPGEWIKVGTGTRTVYWPVIKSFSAPQTTVNLHLNDAISLEGVTEEIETTTGSGSVISELHSLFAVRVTSDPPITPSSSWGATAGPQREGDSVHVRTSRE